MSTTQHSISAEENVMRRSLRKIPLDLLLPVMTGATMSGIGRATNTPELVALPLVMELWNGSIPSPGSEGFGKAMWGYVRYGLGATLVYADKVGPQLYELAQTLVDKL